MESLVAGSYTLRRYCAGNPTFQGKCQTEGAAPRADWQPKNQYDLAKPCNYQWKTHDNRDMGVEFGRTLEEYDCVSMPVQAKKM